MTEPFCLLKSNCVGTIVGQTVSPRGSKTEQITAVVAAQPGDFTLQEIVKACPGVSQDLIRKALGKLR